MKTKPHKAIISLQIGARKHYLQIGQNIKTLKFAYNQTISNSWGLERFRLSRESLLYLNRDML